MPADPATPHRIQLSRATPAPLIELVRALARLQARIDHDAEMADVGRRSKAGK